MQIIKYEELRDDFFLVKNAEDLDTFKKIIKEVKTKVSNICHLIFLLEI